MEILSFGLLDLRRQCGIWVWPRSKREKKRKCNLKPLLYVVYCGEKGLGQNRGTYRSEGCVTLAINPWNKCEHWSENTETTKRNGWVVWPQLRRRAIILFLAASVVLVKEDIKKKAVQFSMHFYSTKNKNKIGPAARLTCGQKNIIAINCGSIFIQARNIFVMILN